MDSWIVIPNWDRFQHYGNRRDTPWIKVYTELNSRDEWLQLGVAERGLLCTIWLEFARAGGQCRASKVQSLCTKSARSSHWQALIDAGFIQLSASRPLALRALARGREEKEKRTRVHAREQKPAATATLEARTNAGAYRPFDDQYKKPWPPDEWLADA